MLKKSKCKRKNQKKQKNLIFLFQIEIRRVGKKFAFSVLGRGHAMFFPEEKVHVDGAGKTGFLGDLLDPDPPDGQEIFHMGKPLFQDVFRECHFHVFEEKPVKSTGAYGAVFCNVFSFQSRIEKVAFHIAEDGFQGFGGFLFRAELPERFQHLRKEA